MLQQLVVVISRRELVSEHHWSASSVSRNEDKLASDSDMLLTVDTARLPSPTVKSYTILDNGVPHDPIEARLPRYLPHLRQSEVVPIEDLELAITNGPCRAEMVGRDSPGHDVGSAALTQARLQEL